LNQRMHTRARLGSSLWSDARPLGPRCLLLAGAALSIDCASV
jgi:hypothetical protein